MKQNLFKFFIVLSNIATIGVFIFSLIVMTTDAQGIFIFIFTIPVMIGLGLFSVFISKKFISSNKYFLQFSKFVIIGLLLFSVSGLVPVLNRIPFATVDFLIRGFTYTVGKTPRQYFKDRNDLQKLIQTELLASSGIKLDFSKINTAHNWTRLCIFTPYTSDLIADQLAGENFKLSQYSDIASSDSIHVVALFDKNSLTNYLNVNRSIIDFELKNSVCVSRADAILYKQDGKFKFR